MGGMPIVMLEEDAMTRLESSAWSLAGGSACVFALTVFLGRQPWQVAFVVVVLAVLGWAWLSPVVAGAAIGGIGWLCVTGFDVHRFGDVRITGRDDVLRVAVLVLAGVLAAAAHALAEAWGRHRSVDPLWAEFHEPARRPTSRPAHQASRPGSGPALSSTEQWETPSSSGCHAGATWPRAERPLPVHPTEEPSDG